MHRIARLLSPILLALAALLLLAWIASHLSIDISRRSASGRYHEFAAIDGLFVLSIHQDPATTELSRAIIHVSAGRFGHRPAWKLYASTPSSTECQLPILYLFAGTLACVFALTGVPAVRRWGRLRRGLCLRCAYPRAPGDAPCPECGVTHAAALAGSGASNVLRNAGIVLFVLFLLLSGGCWYIEHANRRYAAEFESLQFDYGAYLAACEPRLSGVVRIATPGRGATNLASVLSAAKAGDTILLLPGRHEIGRPLRTKTPTDLLILGCGRSVTTLTGQFDSAVRVRIENLTIDCNNDEVLDLRGGGSVVFRGCAIGNYNSGAGGSEAIFGSGVILLVEGCTFDGSKGRAAGSHFGNAFDLRGDNRLYCRDTIFTNNSEVLRSAPCVFDHCTITAPPSPWVYSPGGAAYIRQLSISPVPGKSIGIPFTEALDDLGPLQVLASNGRAAAWADPVAARAAKDLGVRSTSRFWRPLLLHPNAEIRNLVAVQLHLEAVSPPPSSIGDAIKQLKGPVIPSNVVLAIVGRPKEARPALEAVVANGSPEQQSTAGALLQLLDIQPPLAEAVRESVLPRGE